MKKKMSQGSLKNNRTAIVFVKSSTRLYILSYINRHSKSYNYYNIARATHTDYVQFHTKLVTKLEKSKKSNVNIVTTTAYPSIEAETTESCDGPTELDNSKIDNPTKKYNDAIEMTVESIETGKYVYHKKDGIGYYLAFPYYVGYLLEYGVEWPIGMINSFLNCIKVSPKRNKNDYFFTTNMDSINFFEPLPEELAKSARNIYVVCNED